MDKELLRKIPGAQALMDWYGWFPGFHDATGEMHLDHEGNCTLTLDGHQITERVKPDGFFELTKHFTAVFRISGITKASFSGFMPGGMIVHGLQFSHDQDEGFRLEIYGIYGLTGMISANTIELEFKPADAATG